MSTRSLSAILLLVGLAACNDPIGSGEDLAVSVDGRTERGGVLRVIAYDRGIPLPKASVTWTVDPEAAVQWLAPDSVRAVVAGSVRFIASSGGRHGSLAVSINAPPSLLFEAIQGGTREIYRAALDGGDLQRLTDHVAEDVFPTSATATAFFLSSRDTPPALYSVSASGGAATRTTTVAGEYQQPQVAPSGDRVAFVRSVGDDAKIFISNLNGSNAQRLTSSAAGVSEIHPAWSPNGTSVAYSAAETAGGRRQIFMATGPGGAPIDISDSPDTELEPAWSQDGSRIVFTDGSNLRILTITTQQVTTLTTMAGVESSPAWLPTGRIVFLNTSGATRRLYWIDPANPGTPQQIPLSLTLGERVSPLR